MADTDLGVDDPLCAPRLWKLYLAHGKISSIHERIQKISSYYDIISEVAETVNKKDAGEELQSVLEEMKKKVTDAVKETSHPRVLYTMGYPIFSLNGGRFENQLVDVAGGNPVNRMIKRTGKPGVNLSHEEFISLNPDWICISGLFSLPKEECITYCKTHDLMVPAITENKVIELPPSWDFGSPRWILGLMLLAQSFHPEKCTWNMDEVADQFYQRFYHISYRSVQPTRSFIKATAKISG
ncbi:MAG: Periplasmic binding protein [Euryarchaeota archaeon ADurb.Bin294]|nr:MAG: Periplasmic binding protein [Euryarchaeota archaeon ADurb.Bin294]